jgi:hypothetical protein
MGQKGEKRTLHSHFRGAEVKGGPRDGDALENESVRTCRDDSLDVDLETEGLSKGIGEKLARAPLIRKDIESQTAARQSDHEQKRDEA